MLHCSASAWLGMRGMRGQRFVIAQGGQSVSTVVYFKIFPNGLEGSLSRVLFDGLRLFFAIVVLHQFNCKNPIFRIYPLLSLRPGG